MRASPHFTAPREGRSSAGKRVANRFARDDAYASSESTRRTPFAFFSSYASSSDATRVSSLSHSDTPTGSPRFSSDSDASAFPTNCATSTAFLTCFTGTVPGPLTSYHAAPASHPALYPPSALSSLTPLSRAMRNNGLYSWHPCTNDAPRSTFVTGSVMVLEGVVVFFPVPEKGIEESMGSIASSTATTRSGRVSVKTLPPTRSRASRTITSTPALRSTRAALRPAGPAPMTTTRGTRPVVHAVFGRSRGTVFSGSANGGTAARVVFFVAVSAAVSSFRLFFDFAASSFRGRAVRFAAFIFTEGVRTRALFGSCLVWFVLFSPRPCPRLSSRARGERAFALLAFPRFAFLNTLAAAEDDVRNTLLSTSASSASVEPCRRR
mmetsp:Transcript_12618/g.54073  ORF Transcript_12618/g.54073 Transcript_12618/m.54073 type:complete len:380 (+) Transcript_12618:500-1639(+)